jgi:hypothetical protein
MTHLELIQIRHQSIIERLSPWNLSDSLLYCVSLAPLENTRIDLA